MNVLGYGLGALAVVYVVAVIGHDLTHNWVNPWYKQFK